MKKINKVMVVGREGVAPPVEIEMNAEMRGSEFFQVFEK